MSGNRSPAGIIGRLAFQFQWAPWHLAQPLSHLAVTCRYWTDPIDLDTKDELWLRIGDYSGWNRLNRAWGEVVVVLVLTPLPLVSHTWSSPHRSPLWRPNYQLDISPVGMLATLLLDQTRTVNSVSLFHGKILHYIEKGSSSIYVHIATTGQVYSFHMTGQ